MKRVLIICVTLLIAGLGAVVFLWPAQQTGPEPIVYGREMCGHCRMHISRPGFAGEMRDGKGVLTKYDDIGCLLQAMIRLHREIPDAWVEDRAGGGFVPLLSAYLARGSAADTPMGSGIVGFKEEAAALAYTASHHAERVSLEDLVRDPVRLAQTAKTGAH